MNIRKGVCLYCRQSFVAVGLTAHLLTPECKAVRAAIRKAALAASRPGPRSLGRAMGGR